jgi:hypothetical protein
VRWPTLERLAIEVADLDGWIARFETLLGPGFERSTVQQAAGPVDVAIHPAGVELLRNPAAEGPRLRSFHLAAPDLEETARTALELDWTRLDGFTVDGRRHEVFDAEGLRIVLLAGPPT